LEKAMRLTVRLLGEKQIPTLVVGGMAVQEHGYPRFTVDVDIVVPVINRAAWELKKSGYKDAGKPGLFIEPETGVEIDLMQEGDHVNGNQVPQPSPILTTTPKLCSLETLIDLKLGSYSA